MDDSPHQSAIWRSARLNTAGHQPSGVQAKLPLGREPDIGSTDWDHRCHVPTARLVPGAADPLLHVLGLPRPRTKLLSSWAWHYRSQPGYVLCRRPSESRVISDAAHQLSEALGRFRPGLEACDRWAFLHQRPFEEFVHSDAGAFVWTLWLTPEKWDRSPDTSGLHLYPLARPEGMPNTRRHTLRCFEANPVADGVYVHYRENRAAVFPASTFHSIGHCHFEASGVDSMRCSVSIFFDSREHWRALPEIENVTAETATHEF